MDAQETLSRLAYVLGALCLIGAGHLWWRLGASQEWGESREHWPLRRIQMAATGTAISFFLLAVGILLGTAGLF